MDNKRSYSFYKKILMILNR